MKRIILSLAFSVGAALVFSGCVSTGESGAGYGEKSGRGRAGTPHYHGHPHVLKHRKEAPKSPEKTTHGTQEILFLNNPPSSKMAEVGTHVDLTVLASSTLTTNLQFVWQKNGINLLGAASDTLCITSVTTNHVGTYRMCVVAEGLTNYSKEINLSVYSLVCSNSNGGWLYVPRRQWHSAPETVAGENFSFYYSPNDSVFYHLFYGPNASPQFGPFQNTSAAKRLFIGAMGASGQRYGLKLENNFGIGGAARQSTGTGGVSMSPLTLGTSSGTTENSYQVTIFCNDPNALEVIGLTWMYY